MSNFIYDIQLGFLAFPLVALLLAVPYALYQYRRFGAISIWKTFVVFTFILYCLCAVLLIVFPLPADHSAVVESARTPQLHPFHVIEQIRETTDFSLSDRSTWGPALRSPVVYEAIFNVMLTVPLGAYLCYLFRCRWWMALLIGMATTLLFETSQLTGLFGLYAHPYRLFDVDDLILNTAGTMLGFWLMIPLAWALPSMDEVNEQARERGSSRVSLTRRALAAVVDLTVLAVLFVLAWIVLSPTDAQIAKALAVDPSRAGAKTLAFRFIGGLFADPMSALLLALGIGAVLFAVIPMASKGRTIGKTLVGIRIVKADGDDAPAWGYWVRYLASAFFLLIPVALVLLAPEEIEGVSNALPDRWPSRGGMGAHHRCTRDRVVQWIPICVLERGCFGNAPCACEAAGSRERRPEKRWPEREQANRSRQRRIRCIPRRTTERLAGWPSRKPRGRRPVG